MLTPKDVKSLLTQIVRQKANRINLCIWGERASAKSAIPEQVAKEEGLKFYVFRPSTMQDGSEFTGLPFHCVQEGVTRYAPLDWVIDDAVKGNCMIFIDEWNRSNKLVMQGLFSVLDRQVREHRFADSTYIVLAANPDIDGYIVNSTREDAFNSRLSHVYVQMDVSDWLEWADSLSGDSPEYVNKEVRDYIRSNPDSLSSLSEEAMNAANFGKGGLTEVQRNARSWSRSVTQALALDVSQKILSDLLSGMIGPIEAAKFMRFRKEKFKTLTAKDFIEQGEEYESKLSSILDNNTIDGAAMSIFFADLAKNVDELNPKKMIVLLKRLPPNLASKLLAEKTPSGNTIISECGSKKGPALSSEIIKDPVLIKLVISSTQKALGTAKKIKEAA